MRVELELARRHRSGLSREQLFVPLLGVAAALALAWPYGGRGVSFIIVYSWLPLGLWGLTYRPSRVFHGIGLWLLALLLVLHALLRWTTDTTLHGWADAFFLLYLPGAHGVLAITFGTTRFFHWRRRNHAAGAKSLAKLVLILPIALAILWAGLSLLVGPVAGYAVIKARNEPPEVPRPLLLPLPRGLALLMDGGNQCGQGFDPAGCSRSFRVISKDGSHPSVTAQRVADHLERAKSWHSLGGGPKFHGCRFLGGAVHRGQLCVTVTPGSRGGTADVTFDAT